MNTTYPRLATLILASLALSAGNAVWSAEPAGKPAAKSTKSTRAAKKPVNPKTVKPVAAKPVAKSPEQASFVATVTPIAAAAMAAPAVAQAAPANPYLARMAERTANPYLPGAAAVTGNPYLPAQAAAPVVAPAPAPVAAQAPVQAITPAPAQVYAPAPAPASAAPAPADSGFVLANRFNFKDLLPSLPEGQSLLPTVKKVYPTGEKPLVVVTFKCPTELIGVTPAPTKLLHEAVNGGFDLINRTDLLSFNLQQVCQ